jgi:hypothetical protein
LVRFQPPADLECRVHVELPVHALLFWPEVAGRLRHRDDLGPVDLVGVPIGHNGRRAFVEDVLQPIGALTIGRTIKKLSSWWTAMTGASYVRPDRRPTWRTTEVLEPSLPADLKASGGMAQVNKRKAFWIEPLKPQRSQGEGWE